MFPCEESPVLFFFFLSLSPCKRSALFDWDLVFLNTAWLYVQRKDGPVREFAQDSLK